MHLIYEMMTAGIDYKENRHPQKVMKELGITYQHATPQSLYDCWQFWNCENIPSNLPGFISEFKIDPFDMVGDGLSKEVAVKIAAYKNQNSP